MDLHELHRLMTGKEPLVAGAADGCNPFLGLQHYEMFMAAGAGQHHQLAAAPTAPLPAQGMEGFGFPEEAVGGSGQGGGSGGGGRWPRQETLTLLEVRSRLDSKFREAAQKGPLWDEVSRIMAEEHGYHRSGKKCREKLDNLYKYYKKTKEGKAGRQDGKHYRFFRQLEALYGGDTNATNESKQRSCLHSTAASNLHPNQAVTFPTDHPTLSQSLSLSNSSGCSESSSSTREDEGGAVRSKRGRKSWSSKLKDLVDVQITRIIEVQEAWMNKMLKTLENMEQERISREEAWRSEEAARLGREYRLWATERAWIESRNAMILEALDKVSKRESRSQGAVQEESTSLIDLCHGTNTTTTTTNNNNNNNNNNGTTIDSHADVDGAVPSTGATRRWSDDDVASLIKLKSSADAKFLLEGRSTKLEAMWEEIFAEMSSLGYDQCAKRCKEKYWEYMNSHFRSSSRRDCSSNKNSKDKMTTTCPLYSDHDRHTEALCCNEDEDQGLSAAVHHQQISHGHVYRPCHSNYDDVDDASDGGGVHRHPGLLLPASDGDKYPWEDHGINRIHGDDH